MEIIALKLKRDGHSVFRNYFNYNFTAPKRLKHTDKYICQAQIKPYTLLIIIKLTPGPNPKSQARLTTLPLKYLLVYCFVMYKLFLLYSKLCQLYL